MNADVRDFALPDILTVLMGRVVSPRGVDAVYAVLGWMTGERLQPHRMPRASRECRAAILARHPDLAEITPPEDFGDVAVVACWLTVQMSRHGATLELPRLTGWVQPLPVLVLAGVSPRTAPDVLDLYECERLWDLLHATFTDTEA